MDLFGDAHGRGGQKAPLPKICDTYPAIMILDKVIRYLKKIQKTYESRGSPRVFCGHGHFFHRKSSNFAISRNTDIDFLLIHNF